MTTQTWSLLIVVSLAGIYFLWRIRMGAKGGGGCCGDGCGCHKKR